jgi:hypothetical protein
MTSVSGRDAHRRFTTLTSAVLVILGVAMIVRTIAAGGGPLSLGILLGVLFVLAGAGRIAIARGMRG